MKNSFAILTLISLFAIIKISYSQCASSYTITNTPALSDLPSLGPGTVLEVCVKIDTFQNLGANWFHGLSFDFGPQFDMSTLTPTFTSAACATSTGFWDWYDALYRLAPVTDGPGFLAGPGFFFDGTAGSPIGAFDTLPANNYGDNCFDAPDPLTWLFCVTIEYTGGPDPGLLIRFHGDGETGSWTNISCAEQFIYTGTLCPRPYDLEANSLAPDQVVLDWVGSPAATNYRVYYRPVGSSTFSTINLPAVTSLAVFGLMPGTDYEWSIRSRCAPGLFSDFTPPSPFSTPPMRLGAFSNSANELAISIYPNPATEVLNISLSGNFNKETVNASFTAEIFDLSGKSLMSSDQTVVPISALASGTYLVVVNADGQEMKQLFIKQ